MLGYKRQKEGNRQPIEEIRVRWCTLDAKIPEKATGLCGKADEDFFAIQDSNDGMNFFKAANRLESTLLTNHYNDKVNSIISEREYST